MNANRISRPLSLSLVILLVIALSASAFARPTSRPNPPLPVVSWVDVQRYTGLWYEIARYPVLFEAGCAGVTAEYTLRDDGLLDVANACRQGSVDGPERVAVGTAAVADPNTNAKLSVSFAPVPITPSEYEQGDQVPYMVGNYWIIVLDADYQYAVVGDPSRSYLWILSRTPSLDEATLEDLLVQIEAFGYDLDQIIYTPQ